jgi:hypothetical protein
MRVMAGIALGLDEREAAASAGVAAAARSPKGRDQK